MVSASGEVLVVSVVDIMVEEWRIDPSDGSARNNRA